MKKILIELLKNLKNKKKFWKYLMSLNFSKRLFTSLALLLILFVCLFLNKFFGYAYC